MNEFIKLNKEPILKYNDEKVVFPRDISNKIEKHWNDLISEGKTFKRGEEFFRRTVLRRISEDFPRTVLETLRVAVFICMATFF